MLDVHAPHERMQGLRDILLHLLIITIGLLIALSLEGVVEWRHHVHLVEQAEDSLHAELLANQADLKRAVAAIANERATMDRNLDFISRIQKHPSDKAAQKGEMSASFQIINLRETAWQTAQSTGALGYMPYEQAQRYAGVYQRQAVFANAENMVMGDEARFFGQIARTNLRGDMPISAAQAADFADLLGSWKLHLVVIGLMAEDALQTDDALLQGRPEPPGVHEDLH